MTFTTNESKWRRRLKQIGWFIGLYVLSVLAVGIFEYGGRTLLGLHS